MNIILSIMLKLCIPLCGLGFTWERVNPYMFLYLGDNELTKQWHHWSDRGEASIWMKNLLIDIMRATCAIND